MSDKLRGRLSNESQSLRGLVSNQTEQIFGRISTRGGVITDHRLLDNRDAPEQHPIGSITGLSEIVDALNDGFELYCGTSTEVI